MSNYINFYFNEDDKFQAEIHSNGKVRIVKNEKNLLKLLEISKDYGYKVNKEGTIRKKASNISKQYDKYIKRKKRLQILGKITEKMFLSKKNPTIGKTVVIATLLTTLALSGSNMRDSEAHDSNIVETSTSITQTINDEELKDYNYNIDFTERESSTSKIKELQDSKEETQNNENIETNINENKKSELETMLNAEAFHFSYEDRSNKECVTKAKRYEDVFEKYAQQYGLDKNLLIALASQESSGEHYSNLEKGPAAGIMQIEKAIHIGTTISAYNFNTNEVETVKITKEKLNDIEGNIQIGSMIFRNYLEANKYNIPLTLQTYNFGPGNMSKVLSTCSSLENVEESSLRNNPTNNKWLNYRAFLNIGDSKYVEHVFSFLNKDSTINVKNRNNENISIKITNDYVKDNQLS